MKELNNVEMQVVSGAGLISAAAGMLGEGIGSIIDAALGSKNSMLADLGRNVGKGLGSVLESGLDLITKIFGFFKK